MAGTRSLWNVSPFQFLKAVPFDRVSERRDKRVERETESLESGVNCRASSTAGENVAAVFPKRKNRRHKFAWIWYLVLILSDAESFANQAGITRPLLRNGGRNNKEKDKFLADPLSFDGKSLTERMINFFWTIFWREESLFNSSIYLYDKCFTIHSWIWFDRLLLLLLLTFLVQTISEFLSVYFIELIWNITPLFSRFVFSFVADVYTIRATRSQFR